ncbi:MAG TPA: chaperone NapD [Gammaproteobacteria bacterium]
MYIIGLFVIVDPDSYDLVVPEINSFYGCEIKIQNRESGAMLLAITGSDERYNNSLFNKIKALPFVTEAGIMYFYHEGKDANVDTFVPKEVRTELEMPADSAGGTTPSYRGLSEIFRSRH